MRHAFSHKTAPGISIDTGGASAYTHLVVRDANSGHCVCICPHSIFYKFHALFLLVLATVTEHLPILLPLRHRSLEIFCKVRIVSLVRLHRLLGPLQFDMYLIKLLSLHKCRLGCVRVDSETVRLILLPSLIHMEFLLLFGLELLLDSGLKCLFVVGLSSDKVSCRGFEVITDLFGQVLMVTGLLVGLETQCV